MTMTDRPKRIYRKRIPYGMQNFVDKYTRYDCELPKSMVESNVRIDYDKIRMLIRHDKEFTNDASIIQQLVTQGYVTGTLLENFPAERINDPNSFLSLLFYFGMVTIDGTCRGETKFIIPNEVVRDQMYTYLIELLSSTGGAEMAVCDEAKAPF